MTKKFISNTELWDVHLFRLSIFQFFIFKELFLNIRWNLNMFQVISHLLSRLVTCKNIGPDKEIFWA